MEQSVTARGRPTRMRKLAGGIVGIGMALAVAGCASTTTVELPYQPRPAAAAALGAAVVAIGPFQDLRDNDSTWLGAIRGGFGNPLKVLETAVPVVDVVQTAFADGLKARGLKAPDASAPYRLTGVLGRFDCSQYVRREAHIEVQIVVEETASRKVVFSEWFRRNTVSGNLVTLDAGLFASTDDLRAVAMQTLQTAVDEALDSPGFRRAIAAAPAPAPTSPTAAASPPRG